MASVKGTMLVEFIKTIRADKNRAYDKRLSDEAREVASQQILASRWYPFDVYKSCFVAVVDVVAKGDMEMVRQWGHFYGEKIIGAVYKNLVIKGNPAESLDKYKIVHKNFFDFGKFDIDILSENEGIVRIKDFDPDFEPFYHMTRGWMEKNLEMSGAKDIKSEFVSKSWEGAPETSIKLSWKT